MKKHRIGVVSYLNAMPLWLALRDRSDVELIPATPSALCEMMNAGGLDVGLLPVAETFRHPDWTILTDIGISAHGAVESVGLFLREDLPDVKTCALTSASRTSVALTKIVLANAGADPTYRVVEINEDSLATLEDDAVLVIGDACMRARQQETDRVWCDLGLEWRLLTDLPFVFAAWCGPSLSDELRSLLHDAQATSRTQAFEELRHATLATGWNEGELARYITDVIQYELTDDARAGLAEFRRRCEALGLV